MTSGILTHAGTFKSPTSTGDVAYTSVGFTPKAIIFTFSGQTAIGWGTSVHDGIGFAASSAAGDNAAVAVAVTHGQTTATQARRNISGKCISLISSTTGTVLSAAVLKSFDTDGFTLTWSTTAAGNFDMYYLALGGDIADAKVKQWQVATEETAVTGVGFKPDLVLHISDGDTTANASGTTAEIVLGAMDASGNQWCTTTMSQAVATTQTYRHQRNDACLLFDWTGNNYYTAVFVSMDNDGFTYNPSNAGTSGQYVYSLCLKGGVAGEMCVGAWNKSTGANGSVDTVTTATPGLTGALFVTDSHIANTGIFTGSRLTVGFEDGTNHGLVEYQDKTAVTTTVSRSTNYSTLSIMVGDNDAGTGNAYSTSTFSGANIVSTWTLNNAVATQICYIAFGVVSSGWTQTTVPTATSSTYSPAEYASRSWSQSTTPTTASNAITLAEEYAGTSWSQATNPSTVSAVYTPAVSLLWSQTKVPSVTCAVSTIVFWSGKGWNQTTVPTTTSHAITPPFSLVDEDGVDVTNCVVEFIDWPSALEIDIVNV